jgi:hypothetical protein
MTTKIIDSNPAVVAITRDLFGAGWSENDYFLVEIWCEAFHALDEAGATNYIAKRDEERAWLNMNVAIKDNVRLRDQGADPRIILVSDEVVATAREGHRIKADIALAARMHTDECVSYWHAATERLRGKSMRAGVRSVLLGLWTKYEGEYVRHIKKANANV